MSFKISKILHFPQPTLQYIIPQTECDISLSRGLPLLGGVLSDTRNVWHAKGPCLEVRNTKTGTKVGAWTFGSILKDSNTKVVCVEEIQRLNGRLSLLAVGIDCTISGGLICIFDVFGSKVIRAIQIKEKITGLHVVDSGCEVLNLPGPLRNFDGIIAVGTEGGNVFLVDICRQICEEALYTATVRDELYPCQLILLTLKDISKIEYYKEQSVREGDHLAIHLNVVFHSRTEHFTLKGPKGEDRIHVNREEVVTSALYYCSQLTSLLIGFNFGAFQLWDLTSLNLVYTSPVCEEHLPITHFALQEPADDPRAFCYIWVSYSNSELYQTGLPFAVMYSVSYDSKEFHEGYGYLYQDFHSCSVRFQVELGQLEYKSGSKSRGGCCIGLQPVYKVPANKELYAHDNTGDTLALCAISWTVWFNQNETQSYLLVFDLNQWYKEQMPHFTKGSDCSNYILRVGISDLITMAGQRGGPLLDIKIDKKTLRQFSGVQRLEEHFCPTALSFDLWTLGESSIVLLHNEGVQQALLNQIEGAGPLCLIRPSDIYRQIITLGLSPLFIDISMSIPVSTDIQREIILNVGLEHQLVGWLSRCAMEWANGSFSSAGCSLDFLLYWGFQRAILLKNNCDKYCMPLFDYSQSRLDNNTSILLNSCTRQINNVCILYSYVINKLSCFVSNLELITEQYSNLKMVSMYFEVLQWLVNVGLLPECHPSTYPRPDNTERISAPYPVQELTGYYNEKRAQLQLLSKETFVSSDSLLFIDNLINNKCGAEQLQKHWQEDGGSGLYPPPSLQSMLRTYLVEGTDISHKHSLVIYVFLDLAMALDQSRYASVITHLIKFPAVFKVSSSIIKITQAFWQLDHGDYTTAMEQLLDPFVLSDDLQPWHHAIAMRALLLQNQYNFALLYMQVRRPPITDEKDMLTAISLFISNNMLDEAFYFKNQHHSGNEEKLLMHLFNECNKNESLHVLLYKCLTSNEEKAFFKYLKSVENPSLGDLQVFYYLMRSRFVEAFDAHQNSRRKKPECQGLIGQRNATRTDQIVRIFKTLLPDVNRNLVDVIQRERANLWKEVARPTPLSVFVHNTNEQIKYKSTVIQAALAKAKHTFNDSMNNSKFREVVTEETPFVRTPKAYRTISRHVTPVITPKVIEINEFGEEISPSPCKKMKLTPRTSTTSPIWNRNVSINSTMLTPIVKRNASLRKDESLSTSNINVCTPQSILKIRNLVRHSDTMPDDSNVSDMLEDNDVVARLENSSRKSGLGLLPRKSLSRTSHRPHVQFDDAARYSSLFSEQSVKSSRNNTTPENQSLEKSTLSSKDISFMVSSKNSSTSNTSNTDDIFYSPNASINELSKSEEENSGTDRQNRLQNEGGAAEIIADKGEMIIPQHASYVSQSPKARRSYKRSLGDSLPIRTSSRLPRTSSMQSEKSDLESAEKLQIAASREKSVSTDVELPQAHTSTQYQSPRLLQKVKGRKSLNKQVLETDTLSRRKSTSLPSDKPVSKEISLFKTEKTVITEKTSISSEVTTIETKMDLSTTSTQNSDGSHSLTSSSSIFNKKVHELTVDNDTSLELNVSLGNPELPENLKMSNSLVEYMKSRACKYDDSKPESSKTQIASEPMEVYEDLSSGAEDIEEVLTASRQQMDNSKLCGESIKNREDISDELERSNLQRRERSLAEPKAQENLPNISGITSHSSDSFYVPEAEKAFIISPSKLETSVINANSYLSEAELPDIQTDSLSKQPAEVIEIGSSTDEEDSSKREHSDTTSDSRSSEKSDSDIDDLNISYERNIHVEENSRSLIDSEFSATSVGHLNEPNMDEDNHADEIGNIIEDPGVESNNESELEINEDNSTLDQKSNKENEQPLVPEEEESAALKSVHKPEDESRNIIELEHIKEMTMDDNTTEVEISEASIEQRTLKAGDETTEIKITSDISKETSLLHLNEDKAQEKGKNNDKTMNYHSDSKISLHVEIPVEKNEESQKERIIEVIQKQIFKNTKKDSTDKLEENCSKVESSTLSDKSDAKSTKEEMDEIAEHIGQSEQLQKETKEQQTNTSSTLLKDNTTSIYTEKVGKKNQSTNTTIISDKADPELKLLTVRVEQSTSSTGFMSEKNKAVENNDTVLETNKPKDRRVYHPKYGTMKVTSEDQTISSVSSDTTEGESLSQAIVVTAQVHTPSRKRSETPLIKRLTRRNSNLFSQAAESDVLDNVLSEPDISMDVTQFDIMDDDCPNKTHQTPLIKAYVTDILDNSNLEADDSTVTITPGRRNRRSQSSSTTPTRSIKARRLSATEKIEEPLDSNLSVFKRELTVPLKRTRSVSSVDSTQLSRRLLRSNSVEKNIEECDHNKPKTKRKSASVSNLPIISEDNKEQSKIGDRSKSNSTVEAYATTRRLTRRQASLVKGIQTPSSVTAQDDSEMDKSLEVDIIDPIILLDKEPFQGKPDPEEEKVYEQSSPSNSTTSSFSKPTKRVSRSASVASDSSIPPSASQPSTPKRRTRRPIEHMDSPSSGVKTRLRKHSETSSIASEKSDPPTPKRVRKRDTSKEPDENNSDVSVALSTRSTRSRANSTSSIKSDTLNSPKRATRSRRLVSAKSDLPEITEEKS